MRIDLEPELLEEARRDARAGNRRPEQVVLEHLGDRPRAFDPEQHHEDRVVIHQATATARRDELREEAASLRQSLGARMPIVGSGCLTAFLLVLEWVFTRELFIHLGYGALPANAVALLLTIATAVAVGAIRPRN